MLFRKKQKKSATADFLLVGLGNPGLKYEQTRHNVGFLAIDVLADELGANYWKEEGGALTAKARLASGHEVVLAKPQTYMNLSGNSVKKLSEKYRIDPEERLFVLADELDIPAGELRFKKGGGHAGHNGHRSIISSLGTREYHRLRIGIGRPPGKMNAADYVLQSLRPQTYEELLESARQAATMLKEQLASDE
jgi:PTH1 family peptidyl-tRNA hydrolase